MNISEILELTCENNFNDPEFIKIYIKKLDNLISHERRNLLENLEVKEEFKESNTPEKDIIEYEIGLRKESERKIRFFRDQIFSLEKILKTFDIGYQSGQVRSKRLREVLELKEQYKNLEDIDCLEAKRQKLDN